MKKSIIFLTLGFFILLITATTKKVNYSNFPPIGCTGAPPDNITCGFCHSDSPDNSGGGLVQINGIPSSFVLGQTYPFTITIQHGKADRKRFGYDITALDAQGNVVGKLSTNNANATVNTGEITSHLPPILANPTNTANISGFTWTAPATKINMPVTFYFCGNAANGTGTPNGDFIYNNSYVTTAATVTPLQFASFSGSELNGTIHLLWSTYNEVNLKEIQVEKSLDGLHFISIASVSPKGGNNVQEKYDYVDKQTTTQSTNYYRLKGVDKNGELVFSQIQRVMSAQFTNTPKLSVYPNPSNGNFMVQLSGGTKYSEPGYLMITEVATGKIVATYTMLTVNNLLQSRISNTQLSNGLYIAKTIVAGKIVSTKVLISK